VVGAPQVGEDAVGDLGGERRVPGAEGGDEDRRGGRRRRRGAQRAAEAGGALAAERHGVDLALVLDPVLGGEHLAEDGDVVAGRRQRLAERDPVPALDDLRSRDAEPEDQAAARQLLERQGGHRRGAGRAGPDLGDGGAEPERGRAGGDVGERDERVVDPRLGGPDRVVAEALDVAGRVQQVVGAHRAPDRAQAEVHRGPFVGISQRAAARRAARV
jgi:hypothetical protein